MIYVPIVVTRENLGWAIHQNILNAYAALKTKAHVQGNTPLASDLDANSDRLRLVGSSDRDDAACTLEKLAELQS